MKYWSASSMLERRAGGEVRERDAVLARAGRRRHVVAVRGGRRLHDDGGDALAGVSWMVPSPGAATLGSAARSGARRRWRGSCSRGCPSSSPRWAPPRPQPAGACQRLVRLVRHPLVVEHLGLQDVARLRRLPGERLRVGDDVVRETADRPARRRSG